MIARERILALIEIMEEEDIKKLIKEINERYILKEKRTWDNIEEEAPDEIDLEMLRAIKDDVEEYNSFISYEEVNW